MHLKTNVRKAYDIILIGMVDEKIVGLHLEGKSTDEIAEILLPRRVFPAIRGIINAVIHKYETQQAERKAQLARRAAREAEEGSV